ncbi:MAG TPA: peptidylprolyl isomerase [Chromatiales bacterium]|nr:peptidylprolyl isomerase [Chromatiales bacterium]
MQMKFGKNVEKESVVASGKVIEIDYTIKDDNGDLLDSTSDSAPLSYVHGGKKLFSELQEALEGKSAGDTAKVTLLPEQAYGEHDAEKTTTLEAALFETTHDITAGMLFEIPTGSGVQLVTVLSVEGNEVLIDLNHPLAGKTLHIEATINGIRDAELQELEQEKQAT